MRTTPPAAREWLLEKGRCKSALPAYWKRRQTQGWRLPSRFVGAWLARWTERFSLTLHSSKPRRARQCGCARSAPPNKRQPSPLLSASTRLAAHTSGRLKRSSTNRGECVGDDPRLSASTCLDVPRGDELGLWFPLRFPAKRSVFDHRHLNISQQKDLCYVRIFVCAFLCAFHAD